MPLKRTPPISPTPQPGNVSLAPLPPAAATRRDRTPDGTTLGTNRQMVPAALLLQHAGSDSALDNISTRSKRKFVSEETNTMRQFMDEMRSMFTSFTEKQDSKLSDIQKAVAEIRLQNADISKSIEFLSYKYDEMRQELDHLKTDRHETLKYVGVLENKIEQQERISRSNELEIRNIPKVSISESKKDLLATLQKMSNVIGVNINETEIKDIYRTNSNSNSHKPILVEFTTAFKKESILTAYKGFNKQNASNQLNTKQSKINDQNNRIYISESLTFRTRKLFRQARDFAAKHKFRFCWTSHGTIYLRHEEGARLHRVTSESDLEALSQSISA